MLIAVVIVGFFIAGMIDLKLRKKYNIEKNSRFMDQYVGKWHVLLEVLLCLLFLAFVTKYVFDQKTTSILLFFFITVLFVIRGLLEYLFRKDKKRHIISFTYVGLCAVITIAILLFIPQ